MRITSYSSIIASRHDGVMYLAAIWQVVRSDGEVAPGEMVLFEQICNAVNKSLRVRGWLAKPGEDVITEEAYGAVDDVMSQNGKLAQWFESLKNDHRTLLARSLVADIYRIIWKDGKFSIGEKKAVTYIVDKCGIKPEAANLLCLCLGLSEYYNNMAVKTIEGAEIDEKTVRLARKVGRKVDQEADEKRKSGVFGVLGKLTLAFAIPCVIFNLYTFCQHGRNAEVIRHLAEVACVQDGTISEDEYREIRRLSKALRANCASGVFNSVVYYDSPGATNRLVQVDSDTDQTKISKSELDVILEIATAMLHVAAVETIDQERVDYVVGYLKNWGLVEGDCKTGPGGVRCPDMSYDEGSGKPARVYHLSDAVQEVVSHRRNQGGK